MYKFDLVKSCSGKLPYLEHEAAPKKKVPKVSELACATPFSGNSANECMSLPSIPPEIVLRKLGMAQLVIGIDLETRDFIKRSNPRAIGHFGHMCRLHGHDLKQKIVQIGWASGDVLQHSPLRDASSRLVKPLGFSISDRATKHHGITNELASAAGVELRSALETLMGAVRKVVQQGGVVVSHNIEFDASIMVNELYHAGLADCHDEWASIAKNGVCTMGEDIMRWAISCTVGDVELPASTNKLTFMGLKTVVELMVPKSPDVSELLSKKGDASADAQMHRVLYNTYRALAGAAMQRKTGSARLLH